MKRDPIEQTDRYRKAMEKVEWILEREFPADRWRLGTCHAYWHRKKELLAGEGVSWRSPGEMNPDVRFD